MRFVHAGRLFVLCGALSALLSAVPAMAAVNAYMTVKGAKQGPIKGDAMSDSIKLISVVRDTPTGMSTGRRMHATITIVREVDAASPKFATALSTNESLSEVVITLEGATGGAKTAQKIVLTNATILSIRKAGRNEQITLDYQAIQVTWTDGGKTATDDWEAPI
jgi:type VI secretion system secreted protein Hcp